MNQKYKIIFTVYTKITLYIKNTNNYYRQI